MTALLFLIPVMLFVVLATTRWGLHPFLSLLLAALAMGFAGGLESAVILSTLTEGFGNTLRSIGIVIACGVIIGTFLERNGGTAAIAQALLGLVGDRRSPLAMSITGYIVSVPVFCDSGFVILATLNRALSRRTAVPLAVLAIALSTGLYATHVFVPPTPGPLAAAAAVGADLGLVLLLGLLVSIPVVGVGLAWAIYFCKRFDIAPGTLPEPEAAAKPDQPTAASALLPIALPIVLIALRSVAVYPTHPLGAGLVADILTFIGEPVIALLLGVFAAFYSSGGSSASNRFNWVSDGLKNAGAIILITGAGGAFGNILRAADVGAALGSIMMDWKLGVVVPFLIAALFKSAQGSSTVAIITTAALVAPLLEPLGLVSPAARALVVLAIGSGAMTVSHVNDSYFWVVAQFSGMDTATALKCHTAATLLQGLTGITTVAALSMVLL
ncbi:MAG: GntP family permease [Candidatus Marinimicrobia bacterium]|nr:GntP family permease [Candidatus Neomarinimicrobiota bacterium]